MYVFVQDLLPNITSEAKLNGINCRSPVIISRIGHVTFIICRLLENTAFRGSLVAWILLWKALEKSFK